MVTLELKKPSFNVMYYDSNSKRVEWEDVFSTGYWTAIRSRLKGEKADVTKMSEEKRKDYVQQLGLKYSPKTWLNDCMEHLLDAECRYYFWSKCEHECIVKAWPETDSEYKLDVYEQLRSNWDVFSKMALGLV